MEQKKISLKNLYLIAVISIGLIGLGVGSTFAMFTASAEIDNPISLTYNIGYFYDVLETADVELAPGETKTITMNITNDTDSALNYAFWYINEGEYDLDFGIVDSSGNNVSTGTIAAGGGPLTYTISVRNNGDSNASVVIGLSSSDDSVVFSEEMVIMPPQALPSNATPLSDFTYSIGSYDYTDPDNRDYTVTISDNEILLLRYNGDSSNVYIPSTYKIENKIYNTIVISYVSSTIYGYINNSGAFAGTSIETVYFDDGVTIAGIADDVLMRNDADTLFMQSSLISVYNLPSNITSLGRTFERCNNLTGIIEIKSDNVKNAYNIIEYGYPIIEHPPIILKVPENSTTYTTLSNANLPSNVTLTTY